MTTFNTGNPLGSTDVYDRYDNSENLDNFSNGPLDAYADRLGVSRKSLAGLRQDFYDFLASSGFEPAVLDYIDASPLQVDRPTQLLERVSAPGILYSVKLPSAFPVVLSGTWATDEPLLVVRVDQSLRQDLADPTGAELIGRGAGTIETALDAIEADVSALQVAAAEYVRPQDFGAVGDGAADDTAAVLSTIQDGRPIYWGDDSKNYRITSMISHTLARSAVWISNGATITVDSPAAIHRAINITSPGFDFYSSGKLSINCNLKSYNGLYLYNATSFADCRIDDLFVRNVYRSGTTFTGGDGIWIRGAFRNVLLVRPDVRNVRMATGAGISGSQGISGITVSSAGPGLAPQEVTILHPYVAGVFSEDVTYTMDQDGIRVFTEEDIPGVTQTFDSHFTMVGGKFLNCRGRSVKSQCEHGSIVGTHFVRDSSLEPLMSGAGAMSEIDFQVGGGLVNNIEIRYRSAVPARVFTLSGTRTAGKLGTGANISGVRLVLTGGVDLARFAEINMFESLSALYVIRDVSYSGSRNFGSHFVQVSTPLDRTVLLTLENIAARITSDFRYVRKSEVTGTVNAVGRNIQNLNNTTVFGSSTGGTLTTLLEGINVGVSL